MSKFIIDVPTDHRDHIDSLKDKSSGISRVSIVRMLIKGLFGLSKNCSIVIFDDESVRVIKDFKVVAEAGKISENNEVKQLAVSVSFDGASVLHSCRYITDMGGGDIA